MKDALPSWGCALEPAICHGDFCTPDRLRGEEPLRRSDHRSSVSKSSSPNAAKSTITMFSMTPTRVPIGAAACPNESPTWRTSRLMESIQDTPTTRSAMPEKARWNAARSVNEGILNLEAW